MKISLKWLNEYIEVSDYFAKPQELANLLTAGGLEVEGIENLAKQFENVVIGHILERGQHPNADRLTLCQVTTGEGRIHQIVCGAQNHKKDDRVVVALPGAVLPGDFAIKLSKIRGVESAGMLCSEKELALKTESEGILILPADAKIGQSFAEYMGFDDIVFELKVTPNRSDCLSHFGLARELACLLGREARWPLETFTQVASSTKDTVALEVKDTELCPRYAGRVLKGVKVAPSPEWLKKRLQAVGVNSINNVVDVTNFVMFELGQPLHAFDLREIKGNKITVSRSQAGEKFTTLDGTDLSLTGEELTIRDGERAVALAGVVGGKNSGIQDDTKDLFVESAYFNPSGVRKTARRFGVETDSSYRFARGVNPDAIPLAMNRACQLIQSLAGGEIFGEAHDFYPQPVPRPLITISATTLSQRLGYVADAAEFQKWMVRLACEVVGEEVVAGDRVWQIRPPSFRPDLTMDVDLIEEFARLHGYQHIPETLPPTDVPPSPHTPAFVLERKLRRVLQGQGYLQALNYAFVSAKWQEKVLGALDKVSAYGLKCETNAVTLLNPLNEELGAMRVSLLPGLLKNVMHNSRHGNTYGRLFEVGHSHHRSETGYAQEGRLALAIWGAPTGLWQKETVPPVYQLKADLEILLRHFHIQKWKWVPVATGAAPDFMHPGQCVALSVEGRQLGILGTLHPVLQEELKVREAVAVVELNLEKLLQGQPRVSRTKSISKQPAVDRDIALLMPENLAAGEVEALIRQEAGAQLVDVFVFDVFQGGSLSPGQKSVAFRLIFQDPIANLEDAQVNSLRDRIVNACGQKFSLSVR